MLLDRLKAMKILQLATPSFTSLLLFRVYRLIANLALISYNRSGDDRNLNHGSLRCACRLFACLQ